MQTSETSLKYKWTIQWSTNEVKSVIEKTHEETKNQFDDVLVRFLDAFSAAMSMTEDVKNKKRATTTTRSEKKRNENEK